MSIASAPYVVTLTDGRQQMCAELREIYEGLASIYHRGLIRSVEDRRKKGMLDLQVLWKSHRRKLIDAPAS